LRRKTKVDQYIPVEVFIIAGVVVITGVAGFAVKTIENTITRIMIKTATAPTKTKIGHLPPCDRRQQALFLLLFE
jgi:hypothetical protein